MNFAEKIRANLPVDVFTDQDLKLVCRSMSKAAIHSGISRSLKSQEFQKLKRGLYIFGKDLRKEALSKYSIANRMYSPSYISFESALSFHGLIPEAVYTTTSACFQNKKKTFSTPLGAFDFLYIPCRPFFNGVTQLNSALIANPVKALFDLVYINKKSNFNIGYLENDLRMNTEELNSAISNYSFSQAHALAHSYGRKNVVELFELLMRHCK